MPCSSCGKAKNIVEGYVRHIIDPKNRAAAEKFAICGKCDEITWYKIPEYIGYLAGHGLKGITGFKDLTSLPKLEKYAKGENRHPFCRICKCFLHGKTQVNDEVCPLGKW